MKHAIDQVHELIGPYSGVTTLPRRLATAYEPSWLQLYVSGTAPLQLRQPYVRQLQSMAGAGRSQERDTAARISIIEALERLAHCSVPSGLIDSDARSLPGAIDLDQLPRCSETELAAADCPIGVPGKDVPIRWVEGVDLADGSRVYAPAVMVFNALPPTKGENFWLQTSTGVAAGPTWEEAVLSAVCEAVERDMAAVTWLQKMPLPRLDLSDINAETARLIDWCERKFITVHLFDATSEIGVPTVYCVQEAPHDTVAGLIVSASTHPDMRRAAEHAIREGTSLRVSFHGAPADLEGVNSVLRGALELNANPGRRPMNFLLRTPADERPQPMPKLALTGSPSTDLRTVVDSCTRAGHPVYVFDIASPELRTIGLHVARALIPSLQPLSFAKNARYLAHPRLYRVPDLLGYPSRPEGDLNAEPQPFA